MTQTNDDIHFTIDGLAGIITLDRQHALNAVSDDMIQAIAKQLDVWETDPTVERVIVRAAPGKAFSAGGDIRALYDQRETPRVDFFEREYLLNVRIAEFPKPYIALVDGIAMGGGVGISFHGSHVVVGPNASFAMPEVGIGFFPDIGASYFLSRLPGAMGSFLGLTGNRLSGADCVAIGLADFGCEEMDALLRDLCAEADLESVLARHAKGLPGSSIEAHGAWIDEAFSQATVSEIMAHLGQIAAKEPHAAKTLAAKALAAMERNSPTSLAIAFRQIREGAQLSMRECMTMEYRIVSRVLNGREFYEGIRAAIIDKDRAPKWQPSALADVNAAVIDAHFQPLSGDLFA